ncbi:MAG: hypothetical protein M1134_04005 [Actinobacteria bacterium]|nr:hypothetical protein [Actinomycetota bacterium]MCL5445074.1 hypothetical protein [Actinomycetota bacterium]
MSDVSQGPGWWIASDGKWYPPHLHPSVEEQDRLQTTDAGGTTRNGVDLHQDGHSGGEVESSEPGLTKSLAPNNGSLGQGGAGGSQELSGRARQLIGSSDPPEPGSEEARREAAAIATALLASASSSARKGTSHEDRLKHIVVGSVILVVILLAGAGVTATILPRRSPSLSNSNTSSSLASPTTQATPSTQPPVAANLSKYILPTPPRWSVVTTLGPTGTLSASQAGSLGCDGLGGVTLKQRFAWEASQASTWGDNLGYPGTTVTLCLSALGSPADALANLQGLVSTLTSATGLHNAQPAASTPSSTPRPGAPVALVSPAGPTSTYDIVMVRRNVLVFISLHSTSLTTTRLQALASQISSAQAARLP